MPIYVPSDIPTELSSEVYIRQNPWKKIDNVINCVRRSNKIHIPFAHNKEAAEAFKNNPASVLTAVPEDHRAQVDLCTNLPIGTIVVVPNGSKGLLVRIQSAIKAGVQDTLCVAHSPRSCGHTHIRSGSFCTQCHDSVVEVFDSADVASLQRHLRVGHSFEPFYTLFFDVEILGEADYNGVDGRTIAGMSSVGRRTLYWKPV
jgi:hypothetical protein